MTFDRELARIRDAVRTLDYTVTSHAEDEMEEDGLDVLDIESAILNGTIIQRQKDRATGQWKYGIRGQTIDGSTIDVIAKISFSNVVIITTYRL